MKKLIPALLIVVATVCSCAKEQQNTTEEITNAPTPAMDSQEQSDKMPRG